MSYPDFYMLANEPRIDSRLVQEFLDWFDYFDWSEIDEDDRQLIERARALKEAVTGGAATDEDFESECIVLVRENAFTEYIKSECEEIYNGAFKALPNYIRDAIDMDDVATTLRVDYEEFEWDGNTYLYNTAGM